MGADFESRAAELVRRLGSVPGDPAEARAFVQRRVRLYVGVALGIWTAALVLERLVAIALARRLFAASLVGVGLHVGVIAALGLTFVLLRTPRPLVTIGFVELLATTGQAVSLTVMLSLAPATPRPHLTMVLAVTQVLVLRAALVPGWPRRAIGMGVMATLPILVSSALLHRGPSETAPAALDLLAAALWSLVAITSTTVIAAVIYGLEEQARAATRLGSYTLLEKIGEGGMGAVYRARHTLLRRPTAVKTLRASDVEPSSLARFEREVQLTAQIAHPHVVSVYDFGRSTDGVFYYAMELLEGIDLDRLVERHGPLPPPRVLHVLEQAAEALAEAHAFGLIHRDVKPANVMLCRHPRRPDHVKVVDFGLVKDLGGTDPRVTAGNVITGTPLYLSPEAITAPETVDPRSDLYALGASAYFLLTGRPVFDGRTVVEVCARTLHEPVVPPSQRSGLAIPAQLEALVMACLAKSRDDRPRDATELLARLRACNDVAPWRPEDAHDWWRHHETLPAPPTGSSEPPSEGTLALAPRV